MVRLIFVICGSFLLYHHLKEKESFVGCEYHVDPRMVKVI